MPPDSNLECHSESPTNHAVAERCHKTIHCPVFAIDISRLRKEQGV